MLLNHFLIKLKLTHQMDQIKMKTIGLEVIDINKVIMYFFDQIYILYRC